MSLSPLTLQLVEALRCLPGVGPKSAQRMAFHLLDRGRKQGKQLAGTLAQAIDEITHCQRCRTFSEHDLCPLCNNPKRNPAVLCVVESPADVYAIEQTASFNGYYFVLMGHLSPLDGIGPDTLGIPLLKQRLQEEPIEEIILATNPTVEGEATAHFIADLARQQNIKSSRIAHGVPVGGELEYIDGTTLARALSHREAL